MRRFLSSGLVVCLLGLVSPAMAESVGVDPGLRAAKPSLKVSIKGLPGGTAASVTVKGPNRFKKQVTASATLKSLAPGTYKVVAKQVRIGSTTAVPSKSRQTVKVESGKSSVTVRYSRQTSPPPPPPTTGGPQITTTTLPSGMVGQYYQTQIQRTSGGVPFSTAGWGWSAGHPPGLSFDPESGLITGTPTSAGTFAFTVTFTGGGHTDSQPLSLVVAPLPTASTWKLIDAGIATDCGIKSDDTAWCWGFGGFGSLGNGASDDSAFPVAVAGGGTWRTLANDGHACGIKTDGTAWCWGWNFYGQLGNGTTTNADVPVAVSGGGLWTAIDVGDNLTCGIKQDGTAWCWGVGGLGDGTDVTQSLVPVQVLGGADWETITAGDHSCATKSDGSAWCWGYNYYGELGVGTQGQADGFYAEPTQVVTDKKWVGMAGAFSHTCGVAVDATVSCWGHFNEPLGTSGDNPSNLPDEIVEPGPWRSVTTGTTHSCAVKSDDSGWCWGSNGYHQLGDATGNDSSAVPVQLSGSWTTLDNGYFKTCGIHLDGKAFCWGQSTGGSLGDGSTTTSSTPVPVLG